MKGFLALGFVNDLRRSAAGPAGLLVLAVTANQEVRSAAVFGFDGMAETADVARRGP